MDAQETRQFTALLRDSYNRHGRHDMPWRLPDAGGRFNPYKILVSELMLQQTQVSRVTPKYQAFMQQFPAVQDLAGAPLAEVLTAWSGLGYNRRAKFLWIAAQAVVNDHAGRFPETADELQKLPGVGSGTAGAIMAYAYNYPALFVETNIRTVYIHHFFADSTGVTDKQILELLELTLDKERPREFYWSLMDYGAYLKQTVGNLNALSNTYARQSTFQGSRRQIRGQVLRLLLRQPYTIAELTGIIDDERLAAVMEELQREQFVTRRVNTYYLC